MSACVRGFIVRIDIRIQIDGVAHDMRKVI